MEPGEMSTEGGETTGRLFDLFSWSPCSIAHPGLLVPLDGQFAQCDQCGMVCLVTEDSTHKCVEVKS